MNLKKFLKVIFPTLLLLLVVLNTIRDWPKTSFFWNKVSLTPLTFSFILLVVVNPIAALGWQKILSSLKYKVKFKNSFRVWIISNTSRFIPGVIWQYIGRVELAKNELGIGRTTTLVSILIESFLVLVAGLIVASLTFLSVSVNLIKFKLWFLLIPLPLLTLHPFFFTKIINFLGRYSFDQNIYRSYRELNLPDIVSSLFCYIINFLFHGIALYFLVNSFVPYQEFSRLISLEGFYSISWVLGYLAIFAPAGLGVTEATLTYLLSLSLPVGLSGSIALTYRLLMSFSELLVFIFVLRKDERGNI